MANILMLTTQFSKPGEPADSPHQLAEAFIALGHTVKVVVLPWQRHEASVSHYTHIEGLEVLRVPPLKLTQFNHRIALPIRWAFSSLIALFHAKKFISDSKVDFIYTTSPLVSISFLITWLLRKFPHAQSYVYVVDFFPFHQRQIGLIPSGLTFHIAKWAESRLIRMFDIIACMSPKNVHYLKAHYALRPNQVVEILPLSTSIMSPPRADKLAVREYYELPKGKTIAIFGGQITEGRGIEQILDAAAMASKSAPDLHFVLAGDGRLVYLVEDYIRCGGLNVSLIPSLTRSSYIELASACDIGLIVTVPIADIPTFPSKTLDYLQASLPILAAVEADTDFREFVKEHGFGIIVDAGDAKGFLEELIKLSSNAQIRTKMTERGRKTLRNVFDVRRAAKSITKFMGA